MLVLALDTASVFCSAAIAEDGRILAARQDNIGKGHAEHIVPQIAALMRETGKEFSRLDRIGVNIGPGSFTGIRIGVAAARALALALTKPAVGISAFAALRAQALAKADKPAETAVYTVLQAPQGGFYWQYFAAGGAASPPQSGAAADIAAFMRHRPAAERPGGHAPLSLLIGSGAAGLAALLPPLQAARLRLAGAAPTADIAFFAAAAAAMPAGESAPAPLYMRAGVEAPPNKAAPQRAGGGGRPHPGKTGGAA